MKRDSQNATSRLLIHDSMAMSVRHKNIPSVFMVLHPLISLCGILSVIYCMYGFFGFQIDLQFITLTSIAAVFIMFLIRSVSKRAGFAAVILVLLTVPIFLVLYRDDASLGAQNIYGMMHAKIFHEVWTPTGEFISGGVKFKWSPELAVRAIRFLCDIVLVMLIALMEYTDVLLTQGHSGKIAVSIRFLMTFPFLESGLYFGLETSSAAVFMMVGFWIASIALVHPKLPKQTGNIQKTTDKLQRDFLFSSDKHFMPHEMAALMLVLLGGLGAFAALRGSSGYSRTDKINQTRTDLMNMYRNFSFRDITGLLNKIPSSLGINIISDELDLTKRGNLDFDGRTVIKADVGGAADVTDYYMRGIVLSEYIGKGWAVPKTKYEEQMDLFQDLTDLSRVPQTILHYENVDQFLTPQKKFPVVRCHIHALKSEKVNYLPYQTLIDPDESTVKYRYDAEVVLDSYQDYSFMLLSGASPNLRLATSAYLFDTTEPCIRDYQQFVRDTYLDLPETEAFQRVKNNYYASRNLQNAMTEMSRDGYYSFETGTILSLYAIRNYLWNQAEYSTSPGPTPQDEDFVEYFLLKNHHGFCAHYASAAVLLCRLEGIPARYVQGYVMTEGNLADAAMRNKNAGKDDNADLQVEIADDQAHAWVEIYLDGYGWMPFEFTESVMEQWHTMTVAPAATSVSTTTGSKVSTTTTTTMTTAAVTTTAVTRPGEQDGFFNYAFIKKIMNIALIVLCVAAVLFGWYSWHRAVTEKRRREMHGKNPNRSAEASYVYCLRLLELLGIRQKGMSHEAFAIAAEADCRLLESGRLSDTIHMMETVAFSREGIEPDEAEQIADTATALAEHIYQNANRFKRFWIRWIRHMA